MILEKASPLSRYHALLGVASGNDHPSHYDLLGLPRGDVAADRVACAYRDQMRKLQGIKSSRHRAVVDALKAALRTARRTLSSPERKRNYDASLACSPEERLAARARPLLEKSGISTRAIRRLAGRASEVGLDEQRANALLRRWREEGSSGRPGSWVAASVAETAAPAAPSPPSAASSASDDEDPLGWLSSADEGRPLVESLSTWLKGAAASSRRAAARDASSGEGLGWLGRDEASESLSDAHATTTTPAPGARVVFGDIAVDTNDELLGWVDEPEADHPATPDDREKPGAPTQGAPCGESGGCVDAEPSVAFDGWTTGWTTPVDEDVVFERASAAFDEAVVAIREAAREHERLRGFVRVLGRKALVRIEHDGAFRDEVFDLELAACQRAVEDFDRVLAALATLDRAHDPVVSKIHGMAVEVRRWLARGSILRAETRRVDLTVEQADQAWVRFLSADRSPLLATLKEPT